MSTDQLLDELLSVCLNSRINENYIKALRKEILVCDKHLDIACHSLVLCIKKRETLIRKRNEVTFNLMTRLSCRQFDNIMKLAGSWYFDYGVNV